MMQRDLELVREKLRRSDPEKLVLRRACPCVSASLPRAFPRGHARELRARRGLVTGVYRFILRIY